MLRPVRAPRLDTRTTGIELFLTLTRNLIKITEIVETGRHIVQEVQIRGQGKMKLHREKGESELGLKRGALITLHDGMGMGTNVGEAGLRIRGGTMELRGLDMIAEIDRL